jgi:hypothetical protein
MHTIMAPLHFASKGKMMDTLEKFHIYNETHNNNQINDRCTAKPNGIFDALIHLTPTKALQ